MAACGTAGGGMVVVPQGRWLIAPVTLVSNMHLSLEAPGSILVAVASHYGFSDPRCKLPLCCRAQGAGCAVHPLAPSP